MNSTVDGLPVAIVVLNWNGRAETLSCLDALAGVRYVPRHVIVVDNGSTDGSVGALRAAHPELEIIETGRNLGYAGGNNVGIRRALEKGAEYVLVLNNDTRLGAEAVCRAVDVARSLGESAGVVGFATYSYEEPDVLHDLGLREDADEGGFYLNVPTEEELAGKDFLPVTSAHGCAMLLTRRLIETVGTLEESFFLMAEECDLCARARRAGFAVVGATRARVWHKGSGTFGGEQSPLRIFYILRNRPLYVKRRLDETGEAHRFPLYMERYRKDTRYLAAQYLRRLKPRLAFAALAALRCADGQLWGQQRLPLALRLNAWTDMIGVLARSGARTAWRQVSGRGRGSQNGSASE